MAYTRLDPKFQFPALQPQPRAKRVRVSYNPQAHISHFALATLPYLLTCPIPPVMMAAGEWVGNLI